jgi:type VI secretion system protein ImpC
LCAPGDPGLGAPASYAFAIQLADTFAKRRWFDGLIDVEDVGAEEGEAGLSERQMHDISAQGITPLRHRGDGTAAPFSANSTQRPKRFADTLEGRAMALDSLAGAQLSNVLNISRVAHFIETLGREPDVSQDASSLEHALQAWLREYVPGARVSVSQGDYYRYELELRPSSTQPGVTVCVAGTLGEAK